MKIFVDTWGWLTLLDQKESKHLELKEFYSHFRNQRGIVYTSDFADYPDEIEEKRFHGEGADLRRLD